MLCVFRKLHRGLYDKRDRECKKVITLYHDLNAPSIPSLKVWICQNMEKNIPISYNDVDLDKHIFKKDVVTFKGKSKTHHPPILTKNDVIEIPEELKNKGRRIDLYIDFFYIDDKTFLQSLDQTIKLKIITTLQ